MVQKVYAVKNERVIFTAMVVASLFALTITFVAYFSGALTHLFFNAIPSNNPDLLMPSLISSTVSPFLLGLVVLLVLAASMSTLSSLVLVSASSVAMDLFSRVLRPQAPRNQTMLLLRGLSAAFIVFSMVIAISPPSIIVYLMSMSWGTVAGSFLAAFLYGLFWKNTTKAGAIAGVLSGLIISVGLYLWWEQARSTDAAVIAMLVPLVIVPAVSMVTKPFSDQHLALVFGEEPAPAGAAEAKAAAG
jgi:solute:Na+ symporter, SSS family